MRRIVAERPYAFHNAQSLYPTGIPAREKRQVWVVEGLLIVCDGLRKHLRHNGLQRYHRPANRFVKFARNAAGARRTAFIPRTLIVPLAEVWLNRSVARVLHGYGWRDQGRSGL